MVIAGMVLLAGCGGGTKPRAASTPPPEPATLTYCTSHLDSEDAAVVRFNKAHAGDGLRVRLRPLPERAQRAHDTLFRRLREGSCDVAPRRVHRSDARDRAL
jgi:hypothetical protein